MGLGNPGPRYADTRHNVGFRVVDELARRYGASSFDERYAGLFAEVVMPDLRVGLLEPLTYMNDSGRSVAATLEQHPELDPAADLMVVYDDLDLPLGRLRLRPSGGAGGHRGMTSLIESLDRRDFARLRFGIGRPEPGRPVVEHVLEAFTPEQEAQLAERVSLAADAIVCFFESGMAAAMELFNRIDSDQTADVEGGTEADGPEGFGR